ncbi:MAG: MFS transporter [Deltaproteobacteria bacterium]|nr:MFS transporter [Deltaproteobacteria bacterium]
MEKKNNFQTVDAVAISITHLLHDIYSSFLAPILPLLIEKLSISYSSAGFLTVAQRLPSLLNPFVGLIADKISIRYFVIFAPAITAISMSLLGIAPNYVVLVGLLLIMGISATLFHVPAPVMMKRVSGDRIGMGMSFFMFAGEAARTIGPLIILGAVSLWGLEGTFRLIPIGLACSAFLFIRIRNIRISDEFKRKDSQVSWKVTIKHALPTLKILAAFTLSRSLMRGALTIFLPVYLSSKGASIWVAGISLSVVQLTGAAGTIFSGTISDRVGRKATLMVTAIFSPLLMWAFMMVEGIFIFPLLLVMGLFLLAPMPVMLATVNEIKSEQPAFLNGIYMMINFIINSAAVMLIGFMGDRIGLDLTYKISAVVALTAIPVIIRMKP